ncbi:Chaperone protein dnaJ 20, chloroplastic [Linum grandiflorum]
MYSYPLHLKSFTHTELFHSRSIPLPSSRTLITLANQFPKMATYRLTIPTPDAILFGVCSSPSPRSPEPAISVRSPIGRQGSFTFRTRATATATSNDTATDDFYTSAAAAAADAAADATFYDLLGIHESVTQPDIKQAYKQLALKYHPDVSPPDRVEEYTQKFIRVQEAYETLSDPRRRALYDRDMSRGLHMAFSSRRRYSSDEEIGESGYWRNQWESQLSQLKRRSSSRSDNMSWAARIRRQREERSASGL